MKTYFFPVLQFWVGIIFLVSGITKLFPIEGFEYTLVKTNIFSWEIAAYFARFMISFELILGFLLIIHFEPKKTIKVALGVIIFFTLYLIWGIVTGNIDENCGCFGDYIALTPLESIYKNLFMFGSLISILNFSNLKLPSTLPIITTVYISVFLILIFPFFQNPYLTELPDTSNTGKVLNLNGLDKIKVNNSEIDLTKNKQIVCFLMLTCTHCQIAAHKLSIINKKMNDNLPINYYLFGDTLNESKFWTNSHSTKFPYTYVNYENLIQRAGKELPSVFLVENDTIIMRMGLESLESNYIEEFMKK